MKFKSALLTSASGSIGGMTASRNPGGLYLRSRVIPTNPNTNAQQDVRSAMAKVAATWVGDMTTAQRLGWKTFAENVPVKNPLGDNIKISALAWFQKANVMRQRSGVGLGTVKAGPTVYALAELTPLTAVGEGSTPGTIAFTLTPADDWGNNAQGALLVYTGLLVNPTVNFYKGPFTLNSAIFGAVTPPTASRVITLPVPGATGQRCFFRVVATQSDGRPSNDQIYSVDF